MRISNINAALSAVLANPSLGAARALEDALRSAGFQSKVFGRVNQKASLEANSESDRGIAERLANAFDASLTAALRAVGVAKSTRDLTPRKAAQRFFSPTKDRCEWKPPDKRVTLIDLPNRMLLNDRLTQAIGLARRHGKQLAVLDISGCP